MTITEIVAKMRADLQDVGGFENELLSIPAGGVRWYIEKLESALASAPTPEPAGFMQEIEACKANPGPLGAQVQIGPLPEHTAKPAQQDAVDAERFFMDHGVWHDRVTGQHLYTEEQQAAALREVIEEAWSALESANISGIDRNGIRTLPESIRAAIISKKGQP